MKGDLMEKLTAEPKEHLKEERLVALLEMMMADLWAREMVCSLAV